MTKQYIDLVKHVLDQGMLKPNRTGVDTISSFAYAYQHDLETEGFPLLTTKKVNWLHIIVETLHFLSGRSDSGFLRHYGVKFWEPWTEENGLIAGAYAERWRSFPITPELVQVEPRLRAAPTAPRQVRRRFPKEEVTYTGGTRAGEMIQASNGEYFFIFREGSERTADGRKTYDIQFAQTGFIKRNLRMDHIASGSVADPFYPTVCGKGYLGDGERKSERGKLLYQIWAHILDRCYNQQSSHYGNYGGRGVFVGEEWFNFGTFQQDVSSLPGWRQWLERPGTMHLDKDYYSSNCYSKDTCVWLSAAENAIYRDGTRAFWVTALEGDRHLDTKGYTFKYTEGAPYRWQKTNDQIEWLVDTLKRDPLSRRMVVSAWSPQHAQVAKLPPCHCMFVLNTQYKTAYPTASYTDDPDLQYKPQPEHARLNLHLTQRSADIGLGVPYNLAGYAFLLHLFSRFAGLRPGVFAHSLVDAHIYVNHIASLQEQLQRRPSQYPPQLTIDDSIQTLDDIQRLIDDRPPKEELLELFKLQGYDPHPPIKLEVAV